MSAGRFTDQGKTGRKDRANLLIGVSSCLIAAMVSGCTNNLLGGPSLSSSSSLTSTTQVFSISSVIQDQSNPSTTFDVIGDGSGAMGTYCTAGSGDSNAGVDGIGTASSGSSTSSGQTGTSNCGCTYSWTSASEGAGSVNVNTTYHENNMIECPYSMEIFPSDVTTINVSVYLISQDVSPATNSESVSLGNGYGSGVSLTSSSNYVQVSRWQCRDIQTIPYLGGIAGGSLGQGNTIYDPVLSEDAELTYPIDFYTTNLGGTLATFSADSGTAPLTNWRCPGNPNDPNFGNNYNLYSVGADSNGSVQIYPTTGSAFDRSTFYVSKTEAGVFNVPLNTYVAPTLVTSSGSSTLPSVGYGAAPVVTGTDTESCPSVSIPSGYHWVKVWLFRANLPSRYYAVSPAVTEVNAIACNPGHWSDTGNPVFTDCPGTCSTGTCTETCTGTGTSCTVAGGGLLADRVLGGAGIPTSSDPMCVDLNQASAVSGAASGAGGTFDTGSGANYANYTSFALGTDIWLPKGETVVSGGAGVVDPLDLFGLKYGATTADVPKDEALTETNLDTGNTRYDFVFVVTPPTVMAADMENSSNSADYPYIPYRFPTAADCQSSNPNAPLFSGDCDPTKIIHYGLKLHDVSSNGDPPSSDPNASGVFPLCAIQPN